jgi:pimeloyl-ACP methyl ester carboxylesterase
MKAAQFADAVARRPRRAALGWLRWPAVWMAALLLSAPALAAPAAAKPAKELKEGELPKPEDLVVRTDDGLELTLTYYAGTKGRQTIPVVLLHMWKQSRNDFKELAPALQALGYAVIVPDLRGHGESTRMKGPRGDATLSAATMPPQQFARMVGEDMQAVKKFLWERNNAGELNIDKLCVVGAEMGASVALNFALADARDQDYNPVRRADYKLGRFVKALVLISPERTFRGLPIQNAAAYPAVQRDIALLVIVGRQDPKALEQAKRIDGLFEKFHPEPSGDTTSEINDKKTLFFIKLDTSLQGTKLLDAKFDIQSAIADFIDRRLVKSEESREWTWKERKVPHQ